MTAAAPSAQPEAAFRCAAAADLRDDGLAGSAAAVRAWLLVENPGPWGRDAVRDNRLPPPVKEGLAEAARAAGVRVNLVRRHHRAAPRTDFRVFAAHTGPPSPWLETATLAAAEDLLGLDLVALGQGRSPGLEPTTEQLLCVCTHGRHDACCAERGRPVVAALAVAHPEETWEISHIGGDRFAGNAVFLPHGLYYGRLDERSALAVAGSHLTGHLDLDHLRGRASYAMPAQAAEVALRRQLGETRLDALRLLDSRRAEPGAPTEVVFEVAAVRWTVVVRSTADGPGHRLTCRAARDSRVPHHEVLGITRG